MPDTSAKKRRGPAIRLHDEDNVVIAHVPIEPGTDIPGEGVRTNTPVPAGYKIATRAIASGEAIRKYNVTIGFASKDIRAGSMLHNHNIEFREFDRAPNHAAEYVPTQVLPVHEQAVFQGIVRADGRVATRNYIGICSSVNCSATVIRKIAEHFTPDRLAAYPNVDGVVAFAHGLGCGMEMSGEPMQLLRRTIAGFATHVNLAGAIIVGLGCERNQIAGMMQQEGLSTGPRLINMTMQETGGTRATIAMGVAEVEKLLPEANDVRREPVSVSHLKIGLQCGGSDGFSSITANPALGHAVDILCRHGGTAILSETPEIYGVEHTLTRRACSVEVGEKLIERINWWKNEYSPGRDVQINGAVSPGNQIGGLANILEKSLGSAMKGGTGPLMEVYRYAEKVSQPGLVFMDTPGFDPVSATGQIAGGANLICFTTGRGSMFGSKPAPAIKIATNTPMYQRLTEDMDLNAGTIIDGGATLEEVGLQIFEKMISVASGEKTKSEELGLGDNEFVPWSIGIMS
ncbi:UxaA family hydrolase [Loktanella salsilacus]|uniref:UxaA family hydrolase n=1 Tax=Loktanella salsilacus TaxID=195913 RepID=UPI0020B85093|nr:altronate dehydratase family protein [Loktanella salsilacus]UTH46344.1 altronate dehydratase [Loktanella salsilacus]